MPKGNQRIDGNLEQFIYDKTIRLNSWTLLSIYDKTKPQFIYTPIIYSKQKQKQIPNGQRSLRTTRTPSLFPHDQNPPQILRISHPAPHRIINRTQPSHQPSNLYIKSTARWVTKSLITPPTSPCIDLLTGSLTKMPTFKPPSIMYLLIYSRENSRHLMSLSPKLESGFIKNSSSIRSSRAKRQPRHQKQTNSAKSPQSYKVIHTYPKR